MTDLDWTWRNAAESLRREFDDRFTAPHPAPPGPHEDVVAIRVGGRTWGLRVAELLRIEPLKAIVPLPSETPFLLGLAGVQGRLTAVYSLAGLLGLPPEASRWLALYRDDESFALAIGKVEGYRQILLTEAATDTEGRDDGPLPLIDLAALHNRIRSAARESSRSAAVAHMQTALASENPL